MRKLAQILSSARLVQMVYKHLEQQYEEDPEASAAAEAARQLEQLMNQPANLEELPSQLCHDIDSAHDAAVISVQCCFGETAVITGSGVADSPGCHLCSSAALV